MSSTSCAAQPLIDRLGTHSVPNSYRTPGNSEISSSEPDILVEIDGVTSLTDLVKDKNLVGLQRLGGVHGVASTLQTDIASGIRVEDIARRKEEFGSNMYMKLQKKSFFSFVLEAWKGRMVLILLSCVAIAVAFGIKEHGPKDGGIEGAFVIVAVFLVLSVSAFSYHIKQSESNKLLEIRSDIQTDVLRNDLTQQISIYEVVVGDVICLKTGDQVPADGLFLDGESLQVDESSMTGEDDHVEVNSSQNPFLISGTKVADGSARMLATSVGMKTAWGQLMSNIGSNDIEQTVSRYRRNTLISMIEKLGLAVCCLSILVLLVYYFTGNTTDENGKREFNGSKKKVNNIVKAVVVIAAVNVLDVAIPEHLQLAIMLALSHSMKRLTDYKVMVRKVSACDKMRSVSVICVDKIFTREPKIKVTEFWVGLEPIEEDVLSLISPQIAELVQQGVALNTTRGVYHYQRTRGYDCEFEDNYTEKAMKSWAIKELNMDMEELRGKCTVQAKAYHPLKKWNNEILMRKKTDNTLHIHRNGEGETILAMCSNYYTASGIIRPLDKRVRKIFKQIIQGMATRGLLCIAFAHEEEQGPLSSLLGLVGITDPFHPEVRNAVNCRPGVRNAVNNCQCAGVNIMMLTSINILAAKMIATECGILRPNQDLSSGEVIQGEEFRRYTQEERMMKLEKILVMASCSPYDKLLMVKCLKQYGHVVAVTGNETGDAIALKEADIGLSMGIQATEVAKENSDIVILDDNFDSLPTVISWGRCVYNNIRKFIQFQLTVHVSALVFSFIAVVSTGESPLSAVQLLWVNLIVDTLAALALTAEQPTKELMERIPMGHNAPLITNIMWRNLLAQVFYQITVLLTLHFKGQSAFGVNEKVKDTMIFNTFVLCQVFNEFNSRKLESKNVFRGIKKNKLFLRIILITLVLQAAMVEFLKRFADIQRLNWSQWCACVAIAAVSWPIDRVAKCLPVPETPISRLCNLRSIIKRLSSDPDSSLSLPLTAHQIPQG